jgi:hypothetical protein
MHTNIHTYIHTHTHTHLHNTLTHTHTASQARGFVTSFDIRDRRRPDAHPASNFCRHLHWNIPTRCRIVLLVQAPPNAHFEQSSTSLFLQENNKQHNHTLITQVPSQVCKYDVMCMELRTCHAESFAGLQIYIMCMELRAVLHRVPRTVCKYNARMHVGECRIMHVGECHIMHVGECHIMHDEH